MWVMLFNNSWGNLSASRSILHLYHLLPVHTIPIEARKTRKTTLIMHRVAAKRGRRYTGENSHQSEWDDVLPVPKLSFSVASVLVFCLAVLCFAHSYDGEFVFDDLRAITNNRDILPDTPFTAIFSHDFWGQLLDEKSHKSYRPITVMTYRWNYAWAGGLHPRGFHVVNIVLHGLVSVIFLAVFSVLMSGYQVDQESARPVFASPRAALLCAVLFAVHPIHTESVAGIVGRADLLCALTFLLSFLLYARACLSPPCLVSYRPESFSLVSVLASMCLCVVSLIFHISAPCLVSYRPEPFSMVSILANSCLASYRPESSLVSILATSCLVSYRPESFSLVSILASMCLCVVSTFCKEQGITVIGVCSVFDIIVVCRVNPFKWLPDMKCVFVTHCAKSKDIAPWRKSLIKRHLVLILTGVSLLITRIRIMGSTTPIFSENENPHSFVNDTISKILNYNYLYAMNSWLLLNPWWLCYDWSMGCVPVITSLDDLRILAVIALWAGFGALLHCCFHGELTQDRRILITSLAVLGVPFLPASNLFFRVGFVIAERILYLSCAGFCMLVVLGAREICLRLHNNNKKYMSAGLTLLTVIFLIRSSQRSKEFTEELTLYTSAVKVCPLNAKVHYNIGKMQQDINTDIATSEYRLALMLNPRYVSPLINLAIILRKRGDALEAEKLLETAVSVRNGSVDAWMNLGVVQLELKKNDSAVASLTESVRLDNMCTECYFNLGNMYRDFGRPTDAIAAWQRATQISPTSKGSWRNYLLLLEDLEKYDKAIEVGKEALKALPREMDLMFSVANTYIMVDKFQESEDLFLAGLQIDPHSARFHHNLGVMYFRWGKYEKAKNSVTQAHQLAPHDATISSNLQLINRELEESRKSRLP
ncbi:protein O-mannosyl-transferase TMTC4-like [Haliotis rubra]|uniref:protein O-mannosyl-transferase TMTC4-like n=1 Tax=Haliotis rubra TaxID=36100 RepID=UPI001EE5CCA4|nr:protein O-mannosyl-transferase TMTC4-like [Haliotis rubra]